MNPARFALICVAALVAIATAAGTGGAIRCGKSAADVKVNDLPPLTDQEIAE